jgi:hypothetical protein
MSLIKIFSIWILAALGFAQSHDSWLMQNYRFTGPAAAGEIAHSNPAVAQLQEIQSAVLNLLRRASLDGDYEAALAAAAQAAANVQMIAGISGQLRPPRPEPPREPATYRIALRDRTILTASSIWSDGRMLHYLTREGAHGQARLDAVDWKLSADLNRRHEP